MATNPNNAVGTNAAYSGRTSPEALNDVLGLLHGRGIVSGWNCSPSSGMDVTVGGNGSTRDVAVAQDNVGNRVTVNNISGAPITVTIPTAPGSNSRIDSIVAYVNNPPEGTATDTDNPAAVGLIVVSGTVASNPTAPNDATIRTGITADGASGANAFYVVLANVKVNSGVTTVTSNMITKGMDAFLDKVYPIGSIYFSTALSTASAVASALGGTWQAWGSGRVPVGVNTSDTSFNTVEKTGGSKTSAHRHQQTVGSDGNGEFYTINSNSDQVTSGKVNSNVISSTSSTAMDLGNAYSGSTRVQTTYDASPSILQPYITCYMYKRIS